jgi:tetratricopeptide (TPR) repeat protein
MSKLFATIGILLTMTAGQLASATTWSESTVKDPVSGGSVKVQEPMSSGSYIYQWPGKEDQVFWPATDEHWLWFNAKSGYGAFGDDFEKLEDKSLENVRAWLTEHYDKRNPPVTRIEKLKWLEKIYALRQQDEEFWCFFNRLMAYELAESDPAGSLEYVRKAIPQLERQLNGAQQDLARIAVLYLLGEYHRRLGEADAARNYFDQAISSPYKTGEGETLTGAPYFVALIAEREALSAKKPQLNAPPDR